MYRVAPEVALKILPCFEQRHRNAGPSQKQRQHHARRATSHDAAARLSRLPPVLRLGVRHCFPAVPGPGIAVRWILGLFWQVSHSPVACQLILAWRGVDTVTPLSIAAIPAVPSSFAPRLRWRMTTLLAVALLLAGCAIDTAI